MDWHSTVDTEQSFTGNSQLNTSALLLKLFRALTLWYKYRIVCSKSVKSSSRDDKEPALKCWTSLSVKRYSYMLFCELHRSSVLTGLSVCAPLVALCVVNDIPQQKPFDVLLWDRNPLYHQGALAHITAAEVTWGTDRGWEMDTHIHTLNFTTLYST